MVTIPGDVTVEVPGEAGTNTTGTATGQDPTGVSVSYSDVVSNVCGLARVIFREWVVTDAAGNTSRGTQTITVSDTTAPELSAPGEVSLEAPAQPTTNLTGVASATDAGGRVQVSYSDISSNYTAGVAVIGRLWTATDECGNRATASQTIIIRDTAPPTVTIPGDVTVEVPGEAGTNTTGTATGQGPGVSVSYSDVVSNVCGLARVIFREWVVTDAAGNTSRGTQTITVSDTTAPELSAPGEVSLEAPAQPTTNLTGVASATDAGGRVQVSYSDISSNYTAGVAVIGRLWTATDECGNRATASQTIILRDTAPPMVTIPGDVTVEVPGEAGTNTTGTATGQDPTGVSVSYSDVVSNVCGLARVIFREWVVTDAAGNTSRGTQTITVSDTTAPELSAPGEVSLEAPAQPTTNLTGVASATDAGGRVQVSYSDISSNYTAGVAVIGRLWTATDECGNRATATQTIILRDPAPPGIGAPVIVRGPESQTVAAGSRVSFMVEALGSGLSYQWQHNGSDLAGATGSGLSLDHVPLSAAGTYSVVVSNAGGSAQASASLNVTSGGGTVSPPVIVAGPQSQSVEEDTVVSFTVEALGSGLSYQWQHNGSDLAGASLSGLNLGKVQLASAGTYTVVVSNAGGSVSASASLTVTNGGGTVAGPVIVRGPESQTVSVGSRVSFTVQASGSGLSYQWQHNGSDLAGATGSGLSLDNVPLSAAGTYTVVVRNAGGSASASASLSVTNGGGTVAAPVIVSGPESRTVALGGDTTLSVVATGQELSYQWQHEGTNVAGATGSQLELVQVQSADGGSYSVVVS